MLVTGRQQLFINFIVIAVVCGISISIFGNFIPDTRSSLNTIFIGYLLAGCFMLLLYILSWVFVIKSNTNMEDNFFIKLLGTSMPQLMIIGQIIYILIIYSLYHTNLLDNRVASEYYNYYSLFSILILTQTGLLVKFINNINSGNSHYADNLIYLLGTIGFITLETMKKILQHFSTDG
jgi:hypothetical protein